MKIFITIIITIISLLTVNAQTSYRIQNVTVDNVSIPFGAPIDFGTKASVVINFEIQFIKPNNLTIGEVSHVFGTYNSGGASIQFITPEILFLGNNNGGFTTGLQKTIYASDYTYTSGNYLVSSFTQTTGAQTYESNRVPIIKAPVLQLTPTTLPINCGSNSAFTFKVNNVSGTNRALTYQWFYNTNSWSGTNSTSNTLVLTPTSATSLPSNVSVVAYYDGIALNSQTCTVSRPPFNTTATISGTDVICPPANATTYTIANAGAGNLVQWSSSNTAVATISNPTATQVTINKVGFGTFSLSAKITNSCGQIATVSKSVKILNPVIINPSNFTVAPFINSQWCDQKWHYVEIVFPYQTGVTPIFLNVTYNLGTLPSQIPGGIIYKFGKGYSGTFFYDINFYTGCTGFEYSSDSFAPLLIKTCAQLPQGRIANVDSNEKVYRIFPNPTKNSFNIELLQDLTLSLKNSDVIAELFDLFGNRIVSTKLSNELAFINTERLPRGIYILKINIDGKIENHRIQIE